MELKSRNKTQPPKKKKENEENAESLLYKALVMQIQMIYFWLLFFLVTFSLENYIDECRIVN